jgi:hypothetical protein
VLDIIIIPIYSSFNGGGCKTSKYIYSLLAAVTSIKNNSDDYVIELLLIQYARCTYATYLQNTFWVDVLGTELKER